MNAKDIQIKAAEYHDAGDYLSAAYWYKKAADLNYPPSIEGLAFLYHNGYGVSKNIALAITLYRRGASLGDVHCMMDLAWLYYFGEDVPKDLYQAKKWFEMASRAGDKDAIEFLSTHQL